MQRNSLTIFKSYAVIPIQRDYAVKHNNRGHMTTKAQHVSRTEMIHDIILDAAHGENTALIGLIDYLIHDQEIAAERILAIADRRFHIPAQFLTPYINRVQNYCTVL